MKEFSRPYHGVGFGGGPMRSGIVASTTRRIHNPAWKPPGKHCGRRQDAIRRLGLGSMPPIEPLSVQVVKAAGSKAGFIDLARLSDKQEVRNLVEKWDARA